MTSRRGAPKAGNSSTLILDRYATDVTYLSLIIPVYNGADFLGQTLSAARAWLSTLNRPSEILVIDDGSTDGTPDLLREAVRNAGPGPALRWRRNEPNQGKGFAVRRGLVEARGEHRIFMDADLAYPMECVAAILGALEQGADLATADRVHPDSRYLLSPRFIRYFYTRHLFSRFFNLLARIFVVPGVRDTQAGLKGLRRAAALDLAPRLSLTGFSFDLELLYLAHRRGFSRASVPITFVYAGEPTTVRFARAGVQLLVDMARIRLRGIRGAYDRSAGVDAVLAHPACAPGSSE